MLQVVDSLEAGGAERHVVDLALALRRRGHAVQLACSVGGPLAPELRTADVAVHQLMPALVKRRASPEYAARLRRHVTAGRFDVVHAHIHASAVAAGQATDGTGVALVLTEHTEAPWRDALDRFFIAESYRQAVTVIAVSTPVARMLTGRFAVPRTRIRVLPPAITPPEIPPAPRPGRWRGRPLVGRVCRLQPEKGVDVFLRAAAVVREQVPDARFVVVGDGPLAARLGALAEDLGLGPAVEFLGHRPDARALIGALDVMALTSRSEGTPLVVSEALAAGVPTVCSAVGGVPDQVRHGIEGLLVRPDRPADLAAGLVRLLREPGLAARMRRAALRRATAWRHDQMVDEIEAVYGRSAAARAGAVG